MIFLIESSTHKNSLEESLLQMFCDINKQHLCKQCDDFPNDVDINEIIPIGSVQWCMNKYVNITPEYYPTIFNDFYKRKIYKTSLKQILNEKQVQNIFIKPASQYKLFSGQICTFENIVFLFQQFGDVEVYGSEIITIVDEFRLYISQGEIISSAWYDGQITDEEIIQKNQYPSLPDIPAELLKAIESSNYSGIIDIAVTTENTVVIIETCHPFAFGWYIEEESISNSLLFGNFMLSSDIYMTSINNQINPLLTMRVL